MWYHVSQHFTADFDTRVCVDLNQPTLVILINHHIDSKYFKVATTALRVNKGKGRLDHLPANVSDLWQNNVIKALLRIFLKHVIVKLSI